MIKGKERATAVRPQKFEAKKIIAPVDGGLGDHKEGMDDGPNE